MSGRRRGNRGSEDGSKAKHTQEDVMPTEQKTKYANYDEVIFYRKRWIWAILFLPLTPIAILTGDIYQQKDREITAIPRQFRLSICICFGFLILFKFFAPMLIKH